VKRWGKKRRETEHGVMDQEQESGWKGKNNGVEVGTLMD